MPGERRLASAFAAAAGLWLAFLATGTAGIGAFLQAATFASPEGDPFQGRVFLLAAALGAMAVPALAASSCVARRPRLAALLLALPVPLLALAAARDPHWAVLLAVALLFAAVAAALWPARRD
ncbi:MAG: hypothetical protein ACK4PG_08180 [Acetobacteraceae bacterium]